MKISIAALVAVAACSSGAEAVVRKPAGLPPVDDTAAPIAAIAAPTAGFVGVVTTRESKVVVADFEARIDTLLVHAGQPVHAGDAIATLDPSQLARQVDAVRATEAAARADASRASVEVGEARRLLALERRMVAGGAGTAEAVRGAQANVSRAGASAAQAHAAYRAAQADRARLEELLARATLEAPIDGVVSLIRVKEGELALPGTAVARIFDPSDRWIRFAVPPESRAEFPVGARVAVSVPGQPAPLIATIATVSNVLEPPLQLTVVEADLDDGRPETQLAEVGSMVDVRRMP